MDRLIQNNQLDIKMIMQVHDELVFEVGASVLDKSVELIRQVMVGAANLAVDLDVDVGIGDNWDEAH